MSVFATLLDIFYVWNDASFEITNRLFIYVVKIQIKSSEFRCCDSILK